MSPNGKPGFSCVSGSVASTEAAAPGTEQAYTVTKGETLSHIAKHFYRNASRWQAIFDANRDQLDDPHRIRPGQVLEIPAA